ALTFGASPPSVELKIRYDLNRVPVRPPPPAPDACNRPWNDPGPAFMVVRMAVRRFPRDFASLEAIYAFVREFLAGHQLAGEHAWSLDLIVEELFTNVVKYGS